MNRSMDKRTYQIVVVILLGILAYTLYPKNAGGTCGFCAPYGVHRTEYGCIGIRYEYNPMCPDCGTRIYCIGFVTNEKHCYGIPKWMTDTREEIEMQCASS